jgi:hypothetical protein
MAETYNRAKLAIPSRQHFAAAIVTLPDSVVEVGRIANVARTGASILCQGPDGAVALYTVDAELSTPANPVLRRV